MVEQNTNKAIETVLKSKINGILLQYDHNTGELVEELYKFATIMETERQALVASTIPQNPALSYDSVEKAIELSEGNRLTDDREPIKPVEDYVWGTRPKD